MPDALNARRERQRRRRRKRAAKAHLITVDNVDGRTRASKAFSRIVSGVTNDLGGRDRLSNVEIALIDAFAGAALHVYDLNAKLLLGEDIDLGDHAAAISAMVRVASRIGIQRRLRDVTPDLAEYLDAKVVEESAS